MNLPVLAALALAASSLVITGCGPSSPPVADSTAQSTPAAQPSTPQAEATAPVPATATATAAPVTAAPAAPTAVAEVPAAANSKLLQIQGLASQVPATWTPTQPSSAMRAAQFAVPAAAGADVGEVAAFFFPTGQGGTNEANIERWTAEFSSADGKPVAPKISTSKSGDTEITLVELQGNYARGVGMGTPGQAKPDQALLVAIVKTATGRITLQMYGPNKTVSAQRDNFLKLAKGFRPA